MIPRAISKFLSSDEETPVHSHKSLVVNMAGGASVTELHARDHLVKE